MGKIVTEQYAYDIGSVDQTAKPIQNKCCTKEKLEQFNCALKKTRNQNQCVEEDTFISKYQGFAQHKIKLLIKNTSPAQVPFEFYQTKISGGQFTYSKVVLNNQGDFFFTSVDKRYDGNPSEINLVVSRSVTYSVNALQLIPPEGSGFSVVSSNPDVISVAKTTDQYEGTVYNVSFSKIATEGTPQLYHEHVTVTCPNEKKPNDFVTYHLRFVP